MTTGSEFLSFEVQRMRSYRLVVPALLSTLALGMVPQRVEAQKATSIQDSWLWGAYGGYASIPTVIATTNAPTVGIEWVITRTRYALNVFADQSYFNGISTVADYPTSAVRRVDIQDMRRVGFAGMIFTPEISVIKPYFGFGYSFNFIKQATPQGSTFSSAAARDTVLKRVENSRAEGKVFGEFGVMGTYRRFSPFAQYVVMPTKGKGSWFVNGDGFTNMWQLGLRYNFGSAIEKRW
jgi:hypothetical protein